MGTRCGGVSPFRTLVMVELCCPSFDDNEGDSVWGRRRKRGAGESSSHPDREVPRPPTRAGRPPGRPPLGGVPRDDDICSNESTPWSDQAPQDRRGDGKWRVCNDPVGPPWHSQIDGIGDHDGNGLAGELPSQVGRSLGMELHGNDVGATAE
jgi:hypothetical protein